MTSFEKIIGAIHRLHTKLGRKPTPIEIREEMGGGDFSAIIEGLNVWCRPYGPLEKKSVENTGHRVLSQQEIKEMSLEDRFRLMMTSIMSSYINQDDAEQKHQAEKKELKNSIHELKEVIMVLERELAQKTQVANNLLSELDAAEEKIEKLERLVDPYYSRNYRHKEGGLQ